MRRFCASLIHHIHPLWQKLDIFDDSTNLYSKHCKDILWPNKFIYNSLHLTNLYSKHCKGFYLALNLGVLHSRQQKLVSLNHLEGVHSDIQWYTMVYNYVCIQQTKNITFDHQQIPCTHSVWYHHDQFECLWTILLKQVLKGNCRSLFPGFFVCAHWFLNSMVILQFHKNAVISSF